MSRFAPVTPSAGYNMTKTSADLGASCAGMTRDKASTSRKVSLRDKNCRRSQRKKDSVCESMHGYSRIVGARSILEIENKAGRGARGIELPILDPHDATLRRGGAPSRMAHRSDRIHRTAVMGERAQDIDLVF